MTPDQEKWALASRLMEIHGDDVGLHIMARIEALTQAGDDDGVRFWIAIADRVLKLVGPDEGAWMQ